jgi:hypothetical protein
MDDITRMQEGHALSNVQRSCQNGLIVRDAAAGLRQLALFSKPALVYGLLHTPAKCIVKTDNKCRAPAPDSGCISLCPFVKQPLPMALATESQRKVVPHVRPKEADDDALQQQYFCYSPWDASHSGLHRGIRECVTCRQPLSQNSRMSQARPSADDALPLRLLLRLGLDEACRECSTDASADFTLSCTTLHGIHAHLQRMFPKPSSCGLSAWTGRLLRVLNRCLCQNCAMYVPVSSHCHILHRPHILQAIVCRCIHEKMQVHASRAQEAPLKKAHRQ